MGSSATRRAKGAFHTLLDKSRKPLKELDLDPFGKVASDDISKNKLAKLLAGDDPETAGFVQSVVVDFAQQLAAIIRRFLPLKNGAEPSGSLSTAVSLQAKSARSQ